MTSPTPARSSRSRAPWLSGSSRCESRTATTQRFTRAYQAGDIAAVVALLTEDVSASVPPYSVEFHGRDLVARFLAATGLRPGRGRTRFIPIRANGQPAFGLYVPDPQAGIYHAVGLLVLTLAGDKVCAMTGFDTSTLPRSGLPRTLPR